MPSKKRLTRLEERLQKEAQKLKSQLEKGNKFVFMDIREFD